MVPASTRSALIASWSRDRRRRRRDIASLSDLDLKSDEDSSGKEKLGLAALIGLGESVPNVQQPPPNKISKASFEAHKKAERKERNRLSAERHRKKQREHTENLEWAFEHAQPYCAPSTLAPLTRLVAPSELKSYTDH